MTDSTSPDLAALIKTRLAKVNASQADGSSQIGPVDEPVEESRVIPGTRTIQTPVPAAADSAEDHDLARQIAAARQKAQEDGQDAPEDDPEAEDFRKAAEPLRTAHDAIRARLADGRR